MSRATALEAEKAKLEEMAAQEAASLQAEEEALAAAAADAEQAVAEAVLREQQASQPHQLPHPHAFLEQLCPGFADWQSEKRSLGNPYKKR